MEYFNEDFSKFNSEGSSLRKAQLRMLDILIEFDFICKKNRIDYWLSSGTLLGAKRHKGFIPWDDDLDVQVFQKDYIKLIEILEKELPHEYKIQTNKTDKNYKQYYAKIRDLHSFIEEKGNEDYKLKGIFLDIFPVESVPHKNIKSIINFILIKTKNWNLGGTLLLKIIFLLLHILVPLCYFFIRIFRWCYTNNFGDNYSYSYGIEFNHRNTYNDLLPTQLIEFEKHMFNAPHNVEQCLINNYGSDYMSIPSLENRKVHATKIIFYNE